MRVTTVISGPLHNLAHACGFLWVTYPHPGELGLVGMQVLESGLQGLSLYISFIELSSMGLWKELFMINNNILKVC